MGRLWVGDKHSQTGDKRGTKQDIHFYLDLVLGTIMQMGSRHACTLEIWFKFK